MKILLVNPGRFMTEECCTGKVGVKSLPSQIFLAASYLRKHGKEVDVADAQIGTVSHEGYDTVVVWVSITDGFYENIEYLKRAKTDGKNTVMVLNDPYEGLEVEALQKYEFIDACIRLYEREISLNLYLDGLNKNGSRSYEQGSGIIYKNDGKIIDTGKKPFMKNLTHLASCEQLLRQMNLKRYDRAFITTGRGCAFSCSFCSYARTGLRKRNIDDVVSELEIVGADINEVQLLDLDMPSDKKWTEELCSRINERKIKTTWLTDARADQCTPDLLAKMKKGGCKKLLLGIETCDDKSLAKLSKGVCLETVEKAIYYCKDAGIEPYLALMIGYPWESNDTLKQNEKFLKRHKPNFAISYVWPIRGTKLYDEFIRQGLLKRELGIEDYVYARAQPISSTHYLSKEELKKWLIRLRRKQINTNAFLTAFRTGHWFKSVRTFTNVLRGR